MAFVVSCCDGFGDWLMYWFVFEQDNSCLVVGFNCCCGLFSRCILNENCVWIAKMGNVSRLCWGLVDWFVIIFIVIL